MKIENQKLQKIYNFVKKELDGVCSAHDMFHIERVYKLSKNIFQKEQKADEIVVLSAALLHEILDEKFFKEKIKEQKNKIIDLLDSLELTEEQKEKILYIIENIGFGKSLSGKKLQKTIEFQIVEDADRMEAIGAIGIGRTFAYGGRTGAFMHNPEIKPIENMTKEQYGKSTTTINHFYEKLLKLKDTMNTETGKQVAKQRHKVLEDFLNQFFKEWEGEI